MKYLDIVPRISQMPEETSGPQSSYMRLGCGNPQQDTGIASLALAADPNSLPMLTPKPVESLSFYPCT